MCSLSFSHVWALHCAAVIQTEATSAILTSADHERCCSEHILLQEPSTGPRMIKPRRRKIESILKRKECVRKAPAHAPYSRNGAFNRVVACEEGGTVAKWVCTPHIYRVLSIVFINKLRMLLGKSSADLVFYWTLACILFFTINVTEFLTSHFLLQDEEKTGKFLYNSAKARKNGK